MSRIGIKPVIIPANVTVDIAEGNVVTVKGPKGTLTYTFHPDMILKVENNEIIVDRPDEEHLHKSLSTGVYNACFFQNRQHLRCLCKDSICLFDHLL